MAGRYPPNSGYNRGRRQSRRNDDSSFGSLNGWAVRMGRRNSTLDNQKPW